MAITQTLTTSFKLELLQGVHNFGPTSPDVFRIALYTSTATLDATTTIYTTSDEVVGTGYTAGGEVLTVTTPASSGTTAYVDFGTATWAGATFTAAGALIYNATKSDKAVAVLFFGGDKTVSGSTFTVTFPANDANSALIRIA